MATFPDLLADRAASAIAQTRRLVSNAHQRINTLGSKVSALTPGSWEPLTLGAGWSNVSGYIPAQVRIQQNGLALLVGHIQGGTTTNGTTIATLASGFYNPVHAHSFTANVLAGAAAVSVAGTISGDTDSNSLTDPTITNNSGIVNTGLGFSAGSDDHAHFPGTLAVNGPAHSHTNLSAGQASATPVSYNTVILSLSTSGVLTIQNCPSAATQLSFNEQLPLVTS